MIRLRSALFLLSSASLVALSVSLSAGCTASSTGSGAGAGSDAGAAPGTAAPPGLSCLQLLQCIVDSPDTEAARDACGEKGSEEGKANVIAFATCIDAEKCTDATCIQEKCSASLDVCVTSSAPKTNGTPLGGSAPPGSVPADLVGEWDGARDGETGRLTLNADGSGSWFTAITSQQSACFNFTRVTRSGNVVVGEKKITIYGTSVVKSERRCAPPDEETNLPAVTEELLWHRSSEGDPNVIFLVDSACAAKYPGTEDCNIAGCPIGLYCTSRLTRQ